MIDPRMGSNVVLTMLLDSIDKMFCESRIIERKKRGKKRDRAPTLQIEARS